MFTIVLILYAIVTSAVRIPGVPNIAFVPISNSSSVIVTNRSCDQCLCDSNLSHMILNCFPNDTCQFFVDAPRTYKLEPTANAFLYFPRLIVPNASESCTSNTEYLPNRLSAAVSTYATVLTPSCLLLDDHGYLVTVSSTNRSIVRFHPNNLTTVDQSPSPIFSQAPNNIAYDHGAYYVGFYDYILVLDSSNMSQISQISTSSLSTTRDMIFLNGGQQMIVASMGNSRLVFFNRSSSVLRTYNFIGSQTVSFRMASCM